MEYLSVREIAKMWDLPVLGIKSYCKLGKIEGAILEKGVWKIPNCAIEPRNLLKVLKEEKSARVSGGIYHKVQIELTYNSNHIEGSMLTHEQTRYIYETNTIGMDSGTLNVDDIVETANHFHCINLIIDNAKVKLSQKFIKQLHKSLKNGTRDAHLDWFALGEYKRLPNEVGGKATTDPEKVQEKMAELLSCYNKKANKTLHDIIEFHYQFEIIHPFQDGNGRVGRLIMFKECLKNAIVPFIIDDNLKMFYYRGLQNWSSEKGYLIDTCMAAQDTFKEYLAYFKIMH